MKPEDYLFDIVRSKISGNPLSICSVCSAHPLVIEAVMEQARNYKLPLLIEATCNQVNQFGGYTGMTPQKFHGLVQALARKTNFPIAQLILGGDHLGPYPFRDEPCDSAMGKAEEMVREYVKAGFNKIHLDASMHLGDDKSIASKPLAPDIVARRTAQLCKAAEKITCSEMSRTGVESRLPCFVIGSEVPRPGGLLDSHLEPNITKAEDLKNTVSMSEEAFLSSGLTDAWNRVMAIVVELGFDFNAYEIYPYQRNKSHELCSVLGGYPNLVFEAHSTDYQPRTALKEMVEDGVGILKIGPALTFAMREAIFLLEHIEKELITDEQKLSRISSVLESAMADNPKHWQGYYRERNNTLFVAQKYSYFDRIRYYWALPKVGKSLERLMVNLKNVNHNHIMPLLSQFMPRQYQKIIMGHLERDPETLIKDRIQDVFKSYSSEGLSLSGQQLALKS